MENEIICPNCKKTLPADDIINEAATGKGAHTRHITCGCGEKITYWQITAQLREHKTMGWRFRNWVQSLARNRA
jgi:hypothetical protein